MRLETDHIDGTRLVVGGQLDMAVYSDSTRMNSDSPRDDELSTKQQSSLLDPERPSGVKSDGEGLASAGKYENVCGVLLKRDAKPVVLLPLMGLYFTNCAAGVFVSAWVVFLLRDPTLGNVPADQIGRVTSTTLLFQLIAQTLVCIGAGYFYDLFGRRIMIALSYAMICLALAWIPHTLPSIFHLCMARVLLGIGMQIQLGNPLINDYVHKSTRGKAVVF